MNNNSCDWSGGKQLGLNVYTCLTFAKDQSVPVVLYFIMNYNKNVIICDQIFNNNLKCNQNS